MVEFPLQDNFLEFSWTSGRVFSWRYISEDLDANFPGPVVEFFLDEIFLGIFDSNFPGPVVEFCLGEIFLRILMRISDQKCSEIFLQVMRCGRGVVVLWCGRGGPVVEFFLEIFLRIFFSNFPGPVVDFFLEEIFLGIFYSNFPGPGVDFFP